MPEQEDKITDEEPTEEVIKEDTPQTQQEFEAQEDEKLRYTDVQDGEIIIEDEY